MSDEITAPRSSLYSIGETIAEVDPMLRWIGRHHRIETMADVGAHIGAVTVLAHHHFPTLRVWAYEPHPGVCRHLRKNVQGILPPVHVVEAAVAGSDYRGGPLWERGASLLGSSLFMPDRRGKSHQVDVVLPSTVPPVHLLKIDAEGSEAGILEGYQYFAHMRACIVETHSRDLGLRCRAVLENEDFERVRIVEHQRFPYALELWSR